MACDVDFSIIDGQVGFLCFDFSLLFGAKFAVHVSKHVLLSPMYTVEQTGCDRTGPLWLGANQLEAGGSYPVGP